MSMVVPRDDDGARRMRSVVALAEAFEERCDEVALGEFGGFQLHRRLAPGTGLGWALAIDHDGWSGWLVLECLMRQRTNRAASPLKLARPPDRGRLAAFLGGVRERVSSKFMLSVLEKCVVRLVGSGFADLLEEDGLSLSASMLPLLNLEVLVCLWDVGDRFARLDCSTEWSSGLHTSAQVRQAVSARAHMGLVDGCFVLFPLPSGVPSFCELGERFLASVKSEHEVEAPVPELAPKEQAPVPPLLAHPFFTGACKGTRGPRVCAGNYDPSLALVLHYNVDKLTDPKIEFVGLQARALRLDLIHLLDTRVTATEWPAVKAKLTMALVGTNVKWLFHFFEGGMDGAGSGRCTVGGQIVCRTNRLTKVTCEPVVKLGAAVCIKFNLNKIQYASVGTYWPCANNDEGSFQSLIERAYSGLSAISVLKGGISIAVDAAVASGRSVMVGGDLFRHVASGSVWAGRVGWRMWFIERFGG